MHDIGNVEKYSLLGKRVRGGGYWGVTSEDARDIAAWIGYAEQPADFSRVDRTAEERLRAHQLIRVTFPDHEPVLEDLSWHLEFRKPELRSLLQTTNG